jgi:aspartate/methionine/tyrosine aminotransferase
MTEAAADTKHEPAEFRPMLQKLSPNPGAEMLRYGWRRGGVLSLGQGEGDQPTPDFICAAAYEAMQAGHTFYGQALGLPALRSALARYYRRVYQLEIPYERIFITASGTTAMALSLTTLLDPGDEVLAVTPIWKNLLGAVEVAEASINQVAMDHDDTGAWFLDMDKLKDAITDKTKVILVVTPSNPTGWVMREGQMRELLAIARERGLWIISDEVYGRLTLDAPRAPSFLDVADSRDRLFVINSFSKAWAMTGWRLGWIVGPAFAQASVRDLALYNNMGPSTFLQHGAIEALENGEDFIEEQCATWRDNRRRVHDALTAYDHVDMPWPEATFYAMFKTHKQPDCMTLGRQLIDEQALSLAPGCAFGHVSKGYMRLCFAVSRKKLDDALNRLCDFLERL